jgi:diaminobutyrate-2-oxoglutarate transaminase
MLGQTSGVLESAAADVSVFDAYESAVRSYVRSFPAVFTRAKGATLTDAGGRTYLDFFAGAGSLNYGHNPAPLKQELVDYLNDDGIALGLDFATAPKARFLETLQQRILEPRNMAHRVQFCNPSGANAVEAALKISRLATDRTNVVAFSGAFHGCSAGALAATGGSHFRQGLEAVLPGVTHIPFPESPYGPFDSMDLLRRMVLDSSSGVEKPAAVLLETVQAEGGIYVAPDQFLRDLRVFCTEHDIVLIVDDIQAGCGRTGTFFSHERAGIIPDIVTLSKSISGYGLPLALVLLAPHLDVWKPGQHSGTFRGNQLAFVAGAAALDKYWKDDDFGAEVRRKGDIVRARLSEWSSRIAADIRGLGLLWGIEIGPRAREVSKRCFEMGLILELAGREDGVVKLLPPLTVTDDELVAGLDIIERALTDVLATG